MHTPPIAPQSEFLGQQHKEVMDKMTKALHETAEKAAEQGKAPVPAVPVPTPEVASDDTKDYNVSESCHPATAKYDVNFGPPQPLCPGFLSMEQAGARYASRLTSKRRLSQSQLHCSSPHQILCPTADKPSAIPSTHQPASPSALLCGNPSKLCPVSSMHQLGRLQADTTNDLSAQAKAKRSPTPIHDSVNHRELYAQRSLLAQQGRAHLAQQQELLRLAKAQGLREKAADGSLSVSNEGLTSPNSIPPSTRDEASNSDKEVYANIPIAKASEAADIAARSVDVASSRRSPFIMNSQSLDKAAETLTVEELAVKFQTDCSSVEMYGEMARKSTKDEAAAAKKLAVKHLALQKLLKDEQPIWEQLQQISELKSRLQQDIAAETYAASNSTKMPTENIARTEPPAKKGGIFANWDNMMDQAAKGHCGHLASSGESSTFWTRKYEDPLAFSTYEGYIKPYHRKSSQPAHSTVESPLPTLVLRPDSGPKDRKAQADKPSPPEYCSANSMTPEHVIPTSKPRQPRVIIAPRKEAMETPLPMTASVYAVAHGDPTPAARPPARLSVFLSSPVSSTTVDAKTDARAQKSDSAAANTASQKDPKPAPLYQSTLTRPVRPRTLDGTMRFHRRQFEEITSEGVIMGTIERSAKPFPASKTEGDQADSATEKGQREKLLDELAEDLKQLEEEGENQATMSREMQEAAIEMMRKWVREVPEEEKDEATVGVVPHHTERNLGAFETKEVEVAEENHGDGASESGSEDWVKVSSA